MFEKVLDYLERIEPRLKGRRCKTLSQYYNKAVSGCAAVDLGEYSLQEIEQDFRVILKRYYSNPGPLLELTGEEIKARRILSARNAECIAAAWNLDEVKVGGRLMTVLARIDCVHGLDIALNAVSVPDNTRVVVSALPEDLATISDFTTGWRSCYSPDGNKPAGPLAFLFDRNTLVAYAYNRVTDDPVLGTVPVKLWRQLIHLDMNTGSALFGKAYPGPKPVLSRAAARLVMQWLGVEQAYLLDLAVVQQQTSNQSVLYTATRHGAVYPDPYDYLLRPDRNARPRFEIGTELVPCLSCGALIVHTYDQLICVACAD